MDKNSKVIIFCLIIIIVVISTLYVLLAIRYINASELAGKYLKSVELTAKEIARKDKIEEDNKKDINLVFLGTENVNSKGITIIIKDLNEIAFDWTEDYKLMKKVNNEYIEVEGDYTYDFAEITLDSNREYKQVIDWTDRYGELEKGTYIIEKMIITGNSTVEFRTEEFEIK